MQIISAGGSNEKILDAGSNPNVSILNDSIQKFVTDVNPNNFPAGFLSGRNVGRAVNVMVGKRSILLEKSQTPRYVVSIHDEYGEFVFKQFTDEEIRNAKEIKISYEPVEKIVLESDLKNIFTRKVLLGFLEIVEQNCGKEYSLEQLLGESLKIIKTNESIKKGVDEVISMKGLSADQKDELEQYIRNHVVSLGLYRGTFTPKFILPDELEQETTESETG